MAIGHTTPNGVLITQEMAEACEQYIADCIALPGGHSEKFLSCAESIDENNYGTPDYYYVLGNRIILYDFKYGHKYVEVYENLQLANYIIAIIENHFPIEHCENLDIEARIYQPRCYHQSGPVRSWRPTFEDMTRLTNQLKQAAQSALALNPPCITGDHCRYCRAASACTTLQQAALDLVDREGDGTTHELTPEVLGRELRTLLAAESRIQMRREALEAQALHILTRGDRVPGFAVQHAKGRERFTVDADHVVTLCNWYGVDALAPKETRTPAQLRKLGVPAEVLQPITERIRGAAKLVQSNFQLFNQES